MKEFVTKAWKTDQGLIAHQLVDENGIGKPARRYVAVYCGISWPSADSPAYYCLLGEEFCGHKDGGIIRGKVRLLAESESEGISLDSFFARATDDICHFRCDSTFAAVDEKKYIDFTTAYYDFCSDRQIHLGRMEQAPFEKEFLVGVALIGDWHRSGRLEIPTDSIIHRQLKQIGMHDLGERPEERFFAINAFRFALGAFHKNKPNPGRRRRSRRRNARVI
ncbi:MAG: hypothetical protein HGJ94_06790 [Desulfosarcina sp.]|nr:hypothetical protein [Desulfosarcina sp.]MBC2744154.1 hypothetical protein [Desulfosarcina sp.]MBC2767063.1 hypothetical protein [Desulfosarcina sp.]